MIAFHVTSLLFVQLEKPAAAPKAEFRYCDEQSHKTKHLFTLSTPKNNSHTHNSTIGAGISGIMARVEADTKRADSTLNAAFADIDELMVKAKDVVQLAKKFASVQARAAQVCVVQRFFKSIN